MRSIAFLFIFCIAQTGYTNNSYTSVLMKLNELQLKEKTLQDINANGALTADQKRDLISIQRQMSDLREKIRTTDTGVNQTSDTRNSALAMKNRRPLQLQRKGAYRGVGIIDLVEGPNGDLYSSRPTDPEKILTDDIERSRLQARIGGGLRYLSIVGAIGVGAATSISGQTNSTNIVTID